MLTATSTFSLAPGSHPCLLAVNAAKAVAARPRRRSRSPDNSGPGARKPWIITGRSAAGFRSIPGELRDRSMLGLHWYHLRLLRCLCLRASHPRTVVARHRFYPRILFASRVSAITENSPGIENLLFAPRRRRLISNLYELPTPRTIAFASVRFPGELCERRLT